MEALIDSGAEANVISEDLIRGSGIEIDTSLSLRTISFSKEIVELKGTIEVKLFLSNVWIK